MTIFVYVKNNYGIVIICAFCSPKDGNHMPRYIICQDICLLKDAMFSVGKVPGSMCQSVAFIST